VNLILEPAYAFNCISRRYFQSQGTFLVKNHCITSGSSSSRIIHGPDSDNYDGCASERVVELAAGYCALAFRLLFSSPLFSFRPRANPSRVYRSTHCYRRHEFFNISSTVPF
jgi:hypothetical protein